MKLTTRPWEEKRSYETPNLSKTSMSLIKVRRTAPALAASQPELHWNHRDKVSPRDTERAPPPGRLQQCAHLRNSL